MLPQRHWLKVRFILCGCYLKVLLPTFKLKRLVEMLLSYQVKLPRKNLSPFHVYKSDSQSISCAVISPTPVLQNLCASPPVPDLSVQPAFISPSSIQTCYYFHLPSAARSTHSLTSSAGSLCYYLDKNQHRHTKKVCEICYHTGNYCSKCDMVQERVNL